MITIGHTGDIHLDETNRFEDGKKTLDFIAVEGRRRKIDVWLDGGDVAGVDSPHQTTILERNTLIPFFQVLASQGPLIRTRGNHCALGDHDFTAELKSEHGIWYYDRPMIVKPCAGLMVYVLPYPSKSWLIGNAGPGNILDQKQTIEAGLRAILDFWRESAVVARREGILTVGLFHISISEAKLAGSEIMIGREIELTPHDLDELGFDAGFLSHIHRAQEVTKNWWYAGAPYRQNHGEESYVPSFTTCFLEVGKPPIWELVRTPTAKLTTIRHGVSATHEDIKGADVRYQADLAEEDRASFNRAMIEKEFMTAGARSVVFDIRTIPKTRVRYEAITKARTNVERFRAYCDSLGRSAPPKDQRERCEEKLNELEGGVDG